MGRFSGLGWKTLLGAFAAGVAVVSIVFSIPAYNERARRAEIQEAFRNLSDIETWMTGYYQHYKNYSNGDVCGAAMVPEERARYFAYSCTLTTTAGSPPGRSYKATATGKTRHTAGFTFTIDQNKVRATVSIPSDWGPLPANAGATWVDRRQ